MIKTRTFVYDVGCIGGCLWLTLVMFLLKFDCVKDSGLLRSLTLMIPLAFCMMAWVLISPKKFFNAARMEEMQRQLVSACSAKDGCEEEREEVNSACSTQPPSPRSLRTDSLSSTECSESQPLPSARSTTSSEPFLKTEASDAIDCEDRVVVPERPMATSGMGEGWKNPQFRVIAATWCLGAFWSFNFYAYTVFPVLIAESGPSLQFVSTLYSAEGLLYTAIMMMVLPRLHSNFFLLFFGSTWLLALMP